jgi:hypothetical protein
MRYAGLLLLGAMLSDAAPGAQAPPSLDFEYYRTRIEPIFVKPREAYGPGGTCANCHTHISGRFRLQPLAPGATAWTAQQSRRNFEVVTRLVVPGDPLKSRLLLHPLAANAGGDAAHLGGKHWSTQDDPEWQTLAEWVRKAPPGAAAPAPEPTLDFDVFRTRVEPMLLAKRKGLARCYTCHSQGTGFRLQPLARGTTSWSEEESRRNYEAVQRLVVPGDPQSSRLLMVPLASNAGGDPFHPGGKHWQSERDPEWQMLAAWVRGQRPTEP